MVPPSGELTLEMKRVFPAAPRVVFAAFSDPESLAKWWGPEGFTVPRLEFDPHVGAGYRIEMQPSHGDPFYLAGEFREVDPPALLVFAFVHEAPDPDDVETLVELSFSGSRRVDGGRLLPGPVQDGGVSRASPGWLDGQFRQARAIHLEAITMRHSPIPRARPEATGKATVGGS